MAEHDFESPDARVLAERLDGLSSVFKAGLDGVNKRVDELRDTVHELGTEVERTGREFREEVSDNEQSIAALSSRASATEATLSSHLTEDASNETRRQWALGLAIASIVTVVAGIAAAMLR